MEEKRNTIGRWISLLYRYGQMYAAERLKHSGIGKGQYIFLNALYRQDGINQEELSDYLKIDKGTTAKAIKKLEAEGFVRRTVSMDDRRVNRLHLTDKAMDIKGEVRATLLSWRNILTEGFTEEEKDLALELLERMGNNAARFAVNKNDKGMTE